MMMTVYLSHGLESGPGALKMQALKGIAEQLDDCEPVVMDYRGMDEPAERLKHLTATLLARGDDPARCVLAGSSLGGWLIYSRHFRSAAMIPHVASWQGLALVAG